MLEFAPWNLQKSGKLLGGGFFNTYIIIYIYTCMYVCIYIYIGDGVVDCLTLILQFKSQANDLHIRKGEHDLESTCYILNIVKQEYRPSKLVNQ